MCVCPWLGGLPGPGWGQRAERRALAPFLSLALPLQTRSSRHTQGAQPGLADQAAKLSYASAESLETMSEAELPLGFSRMNRFRQSLPLSRSASQSKLRSPGTACPPSSSGPWLLPLLRQPCSPLPLDLDHHLSSAIFLEASPSLVSLPGPLPALSPHLSIISPPSAPPAPPLSPLALSLALFSSPPSYPPFSPLHPSATTLPQFLSRLLPPPIPFPLLGSQLPGAREGPGRPAA